MFDLLNDLDLEADLIDVIDRMRPLIGETTCRR